MVLNLLKDGIQVVDFPSEELILKIQKIVSRDFSEDTKYYCQLSRDEFHKLVEQTQTKINELGILNEVIKYMNPIAKKLSKYEDLSWVSVLKLRAIRPMKYTKKNDAVPFHRETLYSEEQIAYQHNLWIPISSVNNLSSIKFFPESHMLLDKSLIIERDDKHPIKVKQFSAGHRIGYPYSPKLINKTPELKTIPDLVPVKINQAAIFSAMLVHGGGVNKSEKIRFSVDTGFIPTNKVKDNKKLFASRNKSHYFKFEEN